MANNRRTGPAVAMWRKASRLERNVRRRFPVIGSQFVLGIKMKGHAGRGGLERIRINVAHDGDDGAGICGRAFLEAARAEKKRNALPGRAIGELRGEQFIDLAKAGVRG